MSAGQRGKTSEKEVEKLLNAVDRKHHAFDWARIYDARSAGGRFPARPGDFELYWSGNFGLLEVKEVAHDYRLPSKNFKAAQIAKLRKRELAGGKVFVLVKHTTTGTWRTPPLDFFVADPNPASWDLRAWNCYDSAQAALFSHPTIKENLNEPAE